MTDAPPTARAAWARSDASAATACAASGAWPPRLSARTCRPARTSSPTTAPPMAPVAPKTTCQEPPGPVVAMLLPLHPWCRCQASATSCQQAVRIVHRVPADPMLLCEHDGMATKMGPPMRRTEASVAEFLAAVPDEQQRQDAQQLCALSCLRSSGDAELASMRAGLPCPGTAAMSTDSAIRAALGLNRVTARNKRQSARPRASPLYRIGAPAGAHYLRYADPGIMQAARPAL